MYLVEGLLAPDTAAHETQPTADGGAGTGSPEGRADPGSQTRPDGPATENLALAARMRRVIAGPGIAGPGRLRRRGIAADQRGKQPGRTQKGADYPVCHPPFPAVSAAARQAGAA